MKPIRFLLLLVEYLRSYRKLHRVVLSRAEIAQREASGLTWVSSGSSLAKTAFSLAVSDALGFWPVFSARWLNAECQQASA